MVGATVATAAAAAEVVSEALEDSCVQIMIGKASANGPPHEVFCCSNVVAGGYLCVAALKQLFGETFDQCSRRTTANCSDPIG
jgi:hypothetical protein